MTLIPAYGRDYKSKKAVLTDWNDDRDFIIASFSHPDDGRYINRPQFNPGDQITIRYSGLRKLLVFTVGGEDVRHLNQKPAKGRQR